MRSRATLPGRGALRFLVLVLLAVGCGTAGPAFDLLPIGAADSSLPDAEPPTDSPAGDSPGPADASIDQAAEASVDAAVDAVTDSTTDTPGDGALGEDAERDAERDAGVENGDSSDVDATGEPDAMDASSASDAAVTETAASDSAAVDGTVDAPSPTYAVGGTLTGLAAGDTVVLEDNGGNPLTLVANGPFSFATSLRSGSGYSVNVSTQPATPAQTCRVTAGAGTVGSAPVTGIVVNCASGTFTIGGTVMGLAAGDGLGLKDNGTDGLLLTSNGAFTFTTPIASGNPYMVTVAGNPATPVAEACAVAKGSGTVGSANVTNVAVMCAPTTFTVGGTLSGLAMGDTVVLQDNGSDALTLNANGAFAFATPIASGSGYAVTVLTNPSSPAQACTVMSGAGSVSGANVTSVTVACAAPTETVGGTLTWLAPGDAVVLQDNGGDNLSLSASGAFTFATPLATGQPYAVTVLTNPTSPTPQTCKVISGGTGVVGTAPVTSPQVVCGPYVLISGQDTPFAITNDGSHLYWTTLAGNIMKMNNDGTNVLTLATGQGSPFGLATDGATVYFAVQGGSIMKVAVNGTGLTPLATGLASPYDVTFIGTTVFWSSYFSPAVTAVNADGTGLTPLVTGVNDYRLGITTDGVSLYWGARNEGTIMKVAPDGTGLTTLATGQGGPDHITTDGTNVYWANDVSSVVMAHVDGTGLSTLASGQNGPAGIATDGTNVYWANESGGTVMKVGVGGAGLTTVASGQANPYGVTVDSANVYWTIYNPSGSVVAAPK